MSSVDTVRVIAIFFVVVIHTAPFREGLFWEQAVFGPAVIINQLARFAVPCFFVLSGFFWYGKCIATNDFLTPTVKQVKRLAVLYVLWSLIFLVVGDLTHISGGAAGVVKHIYWNLTSGLRSPLATLINGTKYHLWFLPALLTCTVIAALFLQRAWLLPLLVLASLLYLLGLLGGAYVATPVGIKLSFNSRNGPMFGLVFFAAGCFLQRYRNALEGNTAGIIILVAGLSLSLLEVYGLNRLYASYLSPDFVLGTLLAGVGAAMIALSALAVFEAPWLSRYGALVLGVYAIHPLFIDLLKPLAQRYDGLTAWEMVFPFIIFFISTGVAGIMSRSRFARQLVA